MVNRSIFFGAVLGLIASCDCDPPPEDLRFETECEYLEYLEEVAERECVVVHIDGDADSYYRGCVRGLLAESRSVRAPFSGGQGPPNYFNALVDGDPRLCPPP